jgi:hypothetical protein
MKIKDLPFSPPHRSVLSYMPPEIRKSLRPEVITALNKIEARIDINYPNSGGYEIDSNSIVLKRSRGMTATHEALHGYDWSQGNAPSQSIQGQLSETDREKMFKLYWGNKRAPVPLVMATGNYYSESISPNKALEYRRQSIMGQPAAEQYATIGQRGPKYVPHYLRRLYKTYKFPKFVRVLYTGD